MMICFKCSGLMSSKGLVSDTLYDHSLSGPTTLSRMFSISLTPFSVNGISDVPV